MWVFGYGSLMWDDWYDDLQCKSKKTGVLRGYRRSFNKASIRNWGTRDIPGPTLNLIPDPNSSCKGMLFEFPNRNRDAVMKRLSDREGIGFEFEELLVRICLSTTVQALVPIYSGKNTLQQKSLEQIVQMILKASGEKGRCRDYVLNLHQQMQSMGIEDPAVEELTSKIQMKEAQQRGGASD